MTMRVTIITTLMGEAGSLLSAGNTYTVSDSFGAYLVGGKRATDTDGVLRQADELSIAADITLASTDDKRLYNCTAPLTTFVPLGLVTKPRTILMPPPSGNLTLTPTGGETINGSTGSLTRTRANNPAGVVIVPYAEGGYGVSGS